MEKKSGIWSLMFEEMPHVLIDNKITTSEQSDVPDCISNT